MFYVCVGWPGACPGLQGSAFVHASPWLLETGLGALLGGTWTSKMAKIMDPTLPLLSVLGFWAIILGYFGGPGNSISVGVSFVLEADFEGLKQDPTYCMV